MAQPPPPLDPRLFRPSQGRRPANLLPVLGVVIVAAVFGVFAVGLFVGGPVGVLTVFPAVFCGVFIVVIVLIVVGVLGQMGGGRRIPPPPPIQQTLVPAGQQGPVELACPNCGGPPQVVDRFGIATCAYCGTRFLVR